MRVAALSLATLLSLSAPALTVKAQEGGATPLRSPVEVHGFLLGTVTGRTTGLRPARGDGSDFVLVEERLRFDVGRATSAGAGLFLVKGDLFHDAGADRFDVDLREAWVGYTAGPLDLRLGRQIVTWGVGDLVFISDVFPKDWESFFSGRPLEYLKLGVDGLRARCSSQTLNGELLIVPFFTPDALPSASRFFFFDPFASVPDQRELRPPRRYSNAELALRLYGLAAGFDLSLYAYRGFWRTPSARLDSGADPAAVVRFYPRLSAYATSAQRSFLEGVLSLEGGHYDSREDRQGTNPSVPNSQWRFLAGYQRQLRPDLTAGIQAYAELMGRHDAYLEALAAGSPSADRIRWVLTARVMQLLDYQAWKLGIFAAYSPTDEDYLLQPEVSHRLSDELAVSLGANVFGGTSETTFFGQFEKSDNVYIGARFDF
jgi:hypothetical protein